MRCRSIRSEVFREVADGVAGDLHSGGGPGVAGGKLGIDTGGMVHKVGVEPGGLDLVLVQVPRQLVDDGPDHLQMSQLLRPDIRQQGLQLWIGHGEPLAQVA